MCHRHKDPMIDLTVLDVKYHGRHASRCALSRFMSQWTSTASDLACPGLPLCKYYPGRAHTFSSLRHCFSLQVRTSRGYQGWALNCILPRNQVRQAAFRSLLASRLTLQDLSGLESWKFWTQCTAFNDSSAEVYGGGCMQSSSMASRLPPCC